MHSIRIITNSFKIQTYLIQLRIIVILRKWLEHYYHDFEGELINRFREFVNNGKIDAEAGLLKRVLEAVEKKESGESSTSGNVFSEDSPDSILPKGSF